MVSVNTLIGLMYFTGVRDHCALIGTIYVVTTVRLLMSGALSIYMLDALT